MEKVACMLKYRVAPKSIRVGYHLPMTKPASKTSEGVKPRLQSTMLPS